jgi:hypothetical protein
MPDFLNTSTKKLSKDASMWGTEISSIIKSWRGLPAQAATAVKFDETSDRMEDGFVTGEIELILGGNVPPIHIPIIIRDYELQPLDVMEVNGEFYPLTGRRLGELAMGTGPFDDRIDPNYTQMDVGTDIAQNVIPPGYRRGMTKAFSESGMIIPRLIVGSRRPEYDQMVREIDASSAEAYAANGTHDILLMAAEKMVNSEGEQALADFSSGKPKRSTPADTKIIWVPKPTDRDRKNGFVTVWSCGGRAFDPEATKLPLDLIRKLYSNPDGGNITRSGVTANFTDRDAATLYSDPAHGVKELDVERLLDRSDVEILSDDGDLHVTCGENIFTRVIVPSTPTEAFSGALASGTLIIGKKFYGREGKGSESNGMGNVLVAGSVENGICIFADRESHIAVGPVKILSKAEHINPLGKFTVYQCMTGSIHTSIVVSPSDVMQSPSVTHSGGSVQITVPDSFKALRVTEVEYACSNPAKANYIAKTAAHGSWIKVASIGAGEFMIDLPYTVKRAYMEIASNGVESNLSNLNSAQTEFMIGAMGLGRKQASALIKKATESGEATVYGVEFASVPAHPDREIAEKIASVNRAFADSIRVWLVKEAAMVGDRGSVDSMLGLGLADEGNVDIFLDNIPKYEETVCELAAAVIDSRVRDSYVTSKALRDAMSAIENLIEQGEKVIQARKVIQSNMAV